MLRAGVFLGLFFEPEDEPKCSSEMSTSRLTRFYIPEDKTLHNHCYKKLKSYRGYTLSQGSAHLVASVYDTPVCVT
jgi:hypothetical protein